MKKNVLLLTILLVSFLGYSQQELKINISNALILKTLEASYEYRLNSQSSVGISALFNFEKKTADFRYNEDRMISPYFRHHFTTNRKWNLFGEVFVGVNSGYKKTDDNNDVFKKFSDTALGIAVGSKYLSKSGLIIDIYGGLGRNLFSSNAPVIVPRIGLNIGWRL